MKLPITRPIFFTGATVLALASMAGFAALQREPTSTNNPAKNPQQQTARPTAADDSGKTTETKSAAAPEPHKAASKTADNAKNTADADAACKALTLASAQQIIGPDARASLPSKPANLETPDTKLTSCAYSNSTGTIQLTVRTPSNSLGVSKNATVFGSERPSNALAVQGYGQTAYWDLAERRLNILSHNTWYIVTHSSGTQANAESVAKLVVLEP